jgi:hypothetical protein
MTTRREFLRQSGAGFGALALACLFAEESSLAQTTMAARPEADRRQLNGGLHHRAKVKRVVQLFMNGGVSQMDTFDYKPVLAKRHGERFDFGLKTAVTSEPGALMKSPFVWTQHGQSGRWVTDVLPEMAKHVDRMAFLMAMASKTNVHGPASYMQNTGFLAPGFPSMGSWLSYGLGSLNENLPNYVVIPDHRGLPYNNSGNFSSGFLPAAHAATLVKPNLSTPISHLHPPEDVSAITPQSERAGLELLERLNRRHAARDAFDTRLEARIKSYELAARMQLSAPEALDLSTESKQTLTAYGVDQDVTRPYGRNCLVARRLLERGVRFVQVWSGMGGPKNNWDNHADIPHELPSIAKTVDRPIAALLQDLDQRGLLDDTLVIWTTEFGRMPFTQGSAGRDHNGGTFVTWLAGAGIKAGTDHGSSDEFGYAAQSGTTWCYDLHATILHLMGIDHERLTIRHNGIDRRLTDVHGHVVQEILA